MLLRTSHFVRWRHVIAWTWDCRAEGKTKNLIDTSRLTTWENRLQTLLTTAVCGRLDLQYSPPVTETVMKLALLAGSHETVTKPYPGYSSE